jgi:DNA-binding response OmpR family regulator
VIELLARVEVVLRRSKKTGSLIEIGDLSVDVNAMRVKRGGTEISLTPKEYELLLLFARNPDMALYRETIYERVWGGDFEPGSKTVDLHIQRLRKKVGWETSLQAVSKVGYRLAVKP